MTYATKNDLINGNFSPLQRSSDPSVPTVAPALPASGSWMVFPVFDLEWSDVSTYIIIIENIVGAPTLASSTYAAKFQTVHNLTQGGANTSYFTDARPAFYDVTADDTALLPDGLWPANLLTGYSTALSTTVAATNTEIMSTGGLRWTRRIRGPHRLLLMPTWVGGTTPGARITVSMTTEYGF